MKLKKSCGFGRLVRAGGLHGRVSSVYIDFDTVGTIVGVQGLSGTFHGVLSHTFPKLYIEHALADIFARFPIKTNSLLTTY